MAMFFSLYYLVHETPGTFDVLTLALTDAPYDSTFKLRNLKPYAEANGNWTIPSTHILAKASH